ncbi:MAG: hypothetical protein JW787_05035 [Sedimentisphaerales bacterium]|nr:hypothetical protein [Sedimentisphaerales bacterium]
MNKSAKRKQNNPQGAQEANNPVNAEEPVKPAIREAFAGWPMILGWIAMLIFTFHACTHMVAAGDTWVAMACGRHFANHGVNTVEPFSANSHKAGPTVETMTEYANALRRDAGYESGMKYSLMRWWADKCANFENWPQWEKSFVKWIHSTGWINQNWLTHVIFYKLVPQSSYADGVSFTSNALVYWKFVIYIITVICVYYVSRIIGANRFLAVVFSCFALFIGRSFLDIRPAGFSNMLVAVFLLILALTLYRNKLYIWLIVPLVVFWCNVHGGYIYVFIMMIPFIGLHLLTCLNRKWTAILYNIAAWPFLFFVIAKAVPDDPEVKIKTSTVLALFLFTILLVVLDITLIFFKNRLVSVGWKGVYHSIGAFIAAFLASILLNPFHLTNLTHTFVISVSKNAERWRDIHEWHPAFDWTNPVGTAVPFLLMFIIISVVFIGWFLAMIFVPGSDSRYPRRKKNDSGSFQWPHIDIVMIIIAALTIYMAIRSRRFIPIAGVAGCPIAAMFLTQLIHVVSARHNFVMGGKFVIPEMPRNLQHTFIAAGALAVIFFGTWWGLKFKCVYLDPWPNDPKFSSVFMRMTASDAKPFYTMKFIKDNKLEGKMFNYWTEGGFIAWGQEPDSNGFTPLQLFMDGRAQAAYNRVTFDEWSYILAGGEITQRILREAKIRNLVLTEDDFKEIGEFMDEQLRKRNVWTMLMPASIFNDPDPEKSSSYYTFKSLELHEFWRLVFFNDKQKLLVDIRTPQGKKLYDGILTGETIYPDEYHANLNRAHKLLVYEPMLKDKEQGLKDAKLAFQANPSPAPILALILDAARFAELRSDVREFCEEYAKNFDEKHEEWRKIDGYRLKVEAARLANYYLAQAAVLQKNEDLKNTYDTQRNFCLSELRRIGMEKRW